MDKTNDSSKSNNPDNPDKDSNPYMKFYGLTFELAIFNIVVIWGGYVLDQYVHTEPIFILLGTALAVVGTIKLLLIKLK